MARFAAFATIFIAIFNSCEASAQSTPAPAISACRDGTRGLSGQCVCPANTHLDAKGECAADFAPTPEPDPPPPLRSADDNLTCEGGRVSDGRCICPGGFEVVPTRGDASGTCVKRNADNCLGGELTVSGSCLCNGQVVMSGETYLLEYAKGKCVPKRCPVQKELRDGKCISTTAVTPADEPNAAPGKELSKQAAVEEQGRRRCGHGTLRTRSGCVPSRHRIPGVYILPSPGLSSASSELRKYYRTYHAPGN